jgi:hypothetical protein
MILVLISAKTIHVGGLKDPSMIKSLNGYDNK